jgi:hypothetical protein
MENRDCVEINNPLPTSPPPDKMNPPMVDCYEIVY